MVLVRMELCIETWMSKKATEVSEIVQDQVKNERIV